MTIALINGRVLTPGGFVKERAVIVEGEHIVAVVPDDALPGGIMRHDLAGATLCPGFIDSQVNGGGGALFNADTSVAAIRRIGAAHRRFGTTAFLPTLISDTLDTMARGIAAVEQAIAQGVPGVIGIHIEGPFLSADRKGVHDPAFFRTLAPEHVALLTSLKGGVTLITLAPERADPSLIRALRDAGAVVALGHSDASYATASAAFDAGSIGVTHLFNAMSQLSGREPGLVGAALERDAVYCPMIVDGRHVAPTTMRLAMRCKPIERMMLVTDAMPTVGSTDSSFDLGGRRVAVRDGVCVTADGTLAGSHLDMATAVRNAVAMLGVTPAKAAMMASAHPAAFLGVGDRMGTIEPGRLANLVALDADGRVIATWIGGEIGT